MRHLKLKLLTLFIFFGSAFAYAGGGSGIGIKLGANFSKNGFIGGDSKFQPGVTAGITYQKKAKKVFAFEIGGYYHLKRSQTGSFNIDEVNIENFKNSFHYVEIPIAFKFYIKKWWNLNFGPYVSYLIAAKGKGINNFGPKNIWNLISDPEFRDENGEAFLSRLDFGIHLGTEFITKSGFGFGARYSQGFGDVTRDSFQWSVSMLKPDSEAIRTSSIIAYIFYQF